MRIAYVELDLPYEDYAIYQKAYGAGTCFAREAKLAWLNTDIDFNLFAFRDNFINYTEEDFKSKSFVWDKGVVERLRDGEPLRTVVPPLADFDIIMHNHRNLWINTDGTNVKQVFWSVFGEPTDAHPNIKYCLNYRQTKPAHNSKVKNYAVQIGPRIDLEYKPRKKEDFVFQCTRLDNQTNAGEVADNCRKYGIKGYFAGVGFRDNNGILYDFNKHLDSVNTIYLREISYETKMDYYGRARLAPFLFKRNPSFNFSVIEALSVGTPLLVPEWDLEERESKDSMGHGGFLIDHQFLKTMVADGRGFLYNGDNFKECFEKAKEIDGRTCHDMALKYSHIEMLKSFEKALREIYADK